MPCGSTLEVHFASVCSVESPSKGDLCLHSHSFLAAISTSGVAIPELTNYSWTMRAMPEDLQAYL